MHAQEWNIISKVTKLGFNCLTLRVYSFKHLRDQPQFSDCMQENDPKLSAEKAHDALAEWMQTEQVLASMYFIHIRAICTNALSNTSQHNGVYLWYKHFCIFLTIYFDITVTYIFIIYASQLHQIFQINLHNLYCWAIKFAKEQTHVCQSFLVYQWACSKCKGAVRQAKYC